MAVVSQSLSGIASGSAPSASTSSNDRQGVDSIAQQLEFYKAIANKRVTNRVHNAQLQIQIEQLERKNAVLQHQLDTVSVANEQLSAAQRHALKQMNSAETLLQISNLEREKQQIAAAARSQVLGRYQVTVESRIIVGDTNWFINMGSDQLQRLLTRLDRETHIQLMMPFIVREELNNIINRCRGKQGEKERRLFDVCMKIRTVLETQPASMILHSSENLSEEAKVAVDRARTNDDKIAIIYLEVLAVVPAILMTQDVMFRVDVCGRGGICSGETRIEDILKQLRQIA